MWGSSYYLENNERITATYNKCLSHMNMTVYKTSIGDNTTLYQWGSLIRCTERTQSISELCNKMFMLYDQQRESLLIIRTSLGKDSPNTFEL